MNILSGAGAEIVFVALGFVGFLVVLYGMHIISRAKASLYWPYVDGLIIESRISGVSDAEGTSFRPKIKYEYRFDGIVFVGDLIAFGMHTRSGAEEFAETCVERYPVGAHVKVYYDPTSKERSVLEPGISWQSYVPFAVGVGFVVYSCFFYYIFTYGKS